MPRKKKTSTVALVYTFEEAMVGALNRCVQLALDLAASKTALAEQIAALTAAHDNSPQVQSARAELGVLETSVQLYCVNHRAELFAEKKSRDYASATIGFRLGNPKVEKRLRDDTFESIAERLTEIEGLEQYALWKAELNKEALLRDRATLTAEQLSLAGLQFAQDETFYIEPKNEVTPRVTKPAEVAA